MDQFRSLQSRRQRCLDQDVRSLWSGLCLLYTSEAKEKALAETKAKAGVAQSEVDKAQKALDAANAAYQEKVAKLQQDEALRKIVVPAEYAKHDIKDYDWFIAHQDEFMKLQPEIDWDAYNQTALGTNKEPVDLANLTSCLLYTSKCQLLRRNRNR